jgi:hypothetical protein
LAAAGRGTLPVDLGRTTAKEHTMGHGAGGSLVVEHDHAWELRTVEHDLGLTVRELCCPGCGAITFR